jgi:choline dehydrogenase
MIDHVFFGPAYRVGMTTFTKVANDPVCINDSDLLTRNDSDRLLPPKVYLAAELLQFELQQTGPLTNPVADYLAWEKVPQSLRSNFSSTVTDALAQFPDDWPEIEYLSAPGYVGNFEDLITSQPKDGYQYATVLAAIVAPLSRGNVTITSTDTNDLPLINPAWLTSEVDQQVAIAAFKRTRELFASKYMSSLLVDATEYWPGPDVQSDEEVSILPQINMHIVPLAPHRRFIVTGSEPHADHVLLPDPRYRPLSSHDGLARQRHMQNGPEVRPHGCH